MYNDIVTLSQYDNINTFGIGAMREVEELNKALSAGYDRPVSTGGGALRVESLEASLKILTHQAKHCVFWQNVPKNPAYSTVEEYNQLRSVGADQGAFLPEGVLPETNDSDYNRAVELVKFLGTTRSVTHPMTLVKTNIGDVITQENTNGILWLLKNLEWGLFNADADMCYLGAATDSTHREGVEFNGLNKMIDSSSVIDMKGKPLTEKVFAEAAQMIASNYGVPTDAYLSFGAHEDLCNLVFPKERVLLPNAAQGGGYTVGGNVNDVATPFGKVNLNPDVFLNVGKTVPTTSPSNAPAAPTTVALAATPMAGSDGVWSAHGGAGTYDYSVTAVNRYGESLPTAITAALTVASGDVAKHAVINITCGAITGSNAPEYYNIYKTAVGGSTKYFVGRVRCDSQTSGSGVTTFNDTGLWMAGTSKAYVGEMTPQVISVKQLAPLMKMDLAVIAPSIRWMILCYLTFLLYAPKKWVRIINIGRADVTAAV